jgi:hypothetical protein
MHIAGQANLVNWMSKMQAHKAYDTPPQNNRQPPPQTTRSAAEDVLYIQRKTNIDKLHVILARLRHEERGAKEVTVFMKNLQRFYTDTELGQDHLGLLFYPPSRSLKTKRTLGNATGRELQKENISMPVVECFPYAHQVSSNKFDQQMFRSLFENNESFQTAIKSYVLENFRIEHEAFKIKYPDNHSKHVLYLGGVVARVVFTQCYPTQEHESTDAVSINTSAQYAMF